MQTSWRSGIIAVVSFAAIAWLGLDRDGSVHSRQTRNASAVERNSPDPLTHCSTEPYFGYPIGEGLVITLIEELF